MTVGEQARDLQLQRGEIEQRLHRFDDQYRDAGVDFDAFAAHMRNVHSR